MTMLTTQAKDASDALLQEASNNHLRESRDQLQHPLNEEARRSSSMIVKYLLENVEEFRQLTELRQQVNKTSAETLGQF
jgi:hypothetical protein